jgi:large subunit ribosomal protein L5
MAEEKKKNPAKTIKTTKAAGTPKASGKKSARSESVGSGIGEKAGKGKAWPFAGIPRLKKQYKEEIAPALKKDLNYKSVMQIPRLEKIVVSMGIGEALTNKKLLDVAISELSLITGQKAVKTKAKKSIANFKIRQGQEIGAMVTLRGKVMYEFLDRLVNVALPRVKDFRGINGNAFDGHGNYALGITEQIIFPEIDFDKIERVAGLNIVIVTTARTDREAKVFFEKFGMPFRKG